MFCLLTLYLVVLGQRRGELCVSLGKSAFFLEKELMLQVNNSFIVDEHDLAFGLSGYLSLLSP